MSADLRVEVDISGMDRILATEPGRVEDWLDGFAEDMVTGIKLSFGTSPDGKSYPRGQSVHVASQPGYPPNPDSGHLRDTITWEDTGYLERTILVGAEYGADLEFGTHGGGGFLSRLFGRSGSGRILPRPFMRPAFDDARKRIEGDARANLDLEVR